MQYDVKVLNAQARPTAVVPAMTTWDRFPALWPELSGEVWACLRAGGITGGCRNVMLYRDSGGVALSVEVGVELTADCPLTGRVVASALPAGRAAVTVHRGSYAELGAAHAAVAEWCAAHGERAAGVRWEVYGPNEPVPWVEVAWLVE
ncbi:GyrI-like domain-containing protein [Dactylosporangium sp. NPDC051541]|uniref:GyrI-like domain-containing protein n=1 Tax=Dactylosporangium sp. NPDC051541 TaxID=3363977 RepID=UPI0037907030